jgi:hypothetical protein
MEMQTNQLPDFLTLSQMSDNDITKLFGVRDFFIYELDFAALASGGVASSSFTIQTDSNFLWQEGCFFADIAGAAQEDSTRVLPLVSCLLIDTSSGRQLSSSSVPLTSQFGPGDKPYILPTPRFFRANTQVTVSLTNFSADTAYNLRLQFIGTKFFKFSNR